MIDPATNAEWKKGKKLTNIAQELDDETVAEANERLAKMGIAPATELTIPDATEEHQAQQEASARKTRSDAGVKRGPKVPHVPEARTDVETTSITVTLTQVQYRELEQIAEKHLAAAGIDPRYLTAGPVEVLLHGRIQKHWRTIIGKGN